MVKFILVTLLSIAFLVAPTIVVVPYIKKSGEVLLLIPALYLGCIFMFGIVWIVEKIENKLKTAPQHRTTTAGCRFSDNRPGFPASAEMLGEMLSQDRKANMKIDRCANCRYLAKMVSHPCTDGKPLSNVLGWACVMFYMTAEDGKSGSICPNWDYTSYGCEMFTPKKIKSDRTSHNTRMK